MEIVINDAKLKMQEIDESNTKVRALLVNEYNQLLIANYGGVYLLPGGSIEKDESIIEAIVRELKEETGQDYVQAEFSYLSYVKYFQKNYPKRNGTFQNRLVKTHYFVANYKGFSELNQMLSEKERKANFTLELISLDEIEKIVSDNQCTNPRNVFFQRELLAVMQLYKNKQDTINIKKLELK